VARPRLELLKALGDATRYDIYERLAASPTPLSTSELAEALGLHPNTVRPHLERLRDVGLLEVSTEVRVGVGRPQHLYALADQAPTLGLEPPPYPLLARMLARLAEVAGVTADEATEVGREQGEVDGTASLGAASCLEAVVERLEEVGFAAEVTAGEDDATAVIGFARCPFRDLAEAHPDLVCGLHRGLVLGFVGAFDEGEVADFHSLVHREPCQVTVVSR
jgi:predicted ArsR family transcriptional regulator